MDFTVNSRLYATPLKKLIRKLGEMRVSEKIKLSIITPHFNASKLLEKLLMSIPQHKDIQMIVVDDKSDGIHVEYIQKLQLKYSFEFYENDRTKSAGACRNIGLEKAKGKWVLFADSDDYFIEGFYDVLSKYFEGNNEVVFFMPTSTYIDTGKIADRHKGYEQILQNYIKNHNIYNESILRYQFTVPWSKIIRKELIKEYGIQFDEVIASNDVMFSAKVGHNMRRFTASKAVIYCVTRNHESLTVNMSEEVFGARLGVNVAYRKFLGENLDENILKSLKPKSANFIIQALFRYGFCKFLEVYSIYKKNNIQWIYPEYFNPLVLFRKFYKKCAIFIKNKKYYNSKK
jgi:glycosyltransferase involved in cell wall biosynthesis